MNWAFLVVKNGPTFAGDSGFIPWSVRYPGAENGHPLQYSCLGNPMDRGAWQATIHGVAKESDMTYWLNNNKYENYITLGLVSFIHDHYRVKVDFPPIIRKCIWSLKTSIYKDKGTYCSPHRKTRRTKKVARKIYIWCIFDVYVIVGDKKHLLRKRLLNNKALRYHTNKRIFFLPKIIEHYRFDSHHRCMCILKRALAEQIHITWKLYTWLSFYTDLWNV